MLKRIRAAALWIAERLDDGAAGEAEAHRPQVTGLPGAGFPCPGCGARLVAQLRSLAESGLIRCDHCGLELKADWGRSPGAREALQSVLQAEDEVARTSSATEAVGGRDG